MPARHPLILLLLLGLLCLISLGISLTSGSVALEAGQIWTALWQSDNTLAGQVVRELRLPRSLAALTTGAMLALAGCLMQVLVRNPLADPYILGISGGASVAALLAMLAGVGGSLLTGSAFVGALVAMLLVFVLSRGHGQWNSNRLLLTGVVLAAGWGAAIGFILNLSPDRSLQRMLFWLMGDLGFARPGALPGGVLILGLIGSLLLARQLNVLTRGELVAGSLGIRTDRLHLSIYLIASLLTATAVTQAGSIGFVGLVVPHLIRLLGYHDHRVLLPAAALLGASLLLLADTVARTLLAPQQLPVGILTAFIGVPLFLYLLYRGARQ